MTVVAAGVDRLGVAGAVALVVGPVARRGGLVIGQAVQLEPQGGDGARPAGVQNGHHPGPALGALHKLRLGPLLHGPVHLLADLLGAQAFGLPHTAGLHHLRSHGYGVAQAGEDFGHPGAGAELPPAVFRVLVELSPVRNNLIHPIPPNAFVGSTPVPPRPRTRPGGGTIYSTLWSSAWPNSSTPRAMSSSLILE